MTLSSSRLRLVAALASVNILLVAGGWFLLVGPQRHDAAAATAQVRQAQTELAAATAAAKHPPHVKQPTFRTSRLYQLAEAMPATGDEPDLLLGIAQLAGTYGVRVADLSPGAPTAASGYTILPISLTLDGGYARLTAFLHRLRTLVALHDGHVVASGRLFSVTSVSLAPASSGHRLTATVALDAFVYGSSAGAPSPSSATGTTSTTTASGQ